MIRREKTILVRIDLLGGENFQDFQITFTNLQRPLVTVREAVGRFQILKRGMSVDSFKLVTRMNALVDDFTSIKDEPYLIFHIPQRIVPLSGNEWTNVQLDQLKIVFQDVDIQKFFNDAGLTQFDMSPRGVELVEKLSNLSSSLACSYVPTQGDNPDDRHATIETIRADPLHQNPITKALFAARMYENLSFIDFVKYLLNEMGFNEGSLYIAPQLRINLSYGETVKMATADVTILDLLSSARIGVVEDKSVEDLINSKAQLVAQGIAMTQHNESLRGGKHTGDESETVYGMRVTGSTFHFFAIKVSSEIQSAMMSQVPADSPTTMYRYKSETGLDFLNKYDREEIILILSLLQQIVATNRESIDDSVV
jgi:hypothetical protein